MELTVENNMKRAVEWYASAFEKGIKDVIFDTSSKEPPSEIEGYPVVSIYDKHQKNYKWFICKNDIAVKKVLYSAPFKTLVERSESEGRVPLGKDFEEDLGILLGFPPSASKRFSKLGNGEVEGRLSINVEGMIFVTYEQTIADDINWLLFTHGYDLTITLNKRIGRREVIKMELDLKDESNIPGMIKGFIKTHAVKRNGNK